MPETDWEAALQTLERADRRLLTLNLEDLAIVDRALMDRFYAISGILALPADPVPYTAVERLQVAFEAGISLAERLTEVRESARAELSHINQIRLTLQTAQPDPRHVDCLG